MREVEIRFHKGATTIVSNTVFTIADHDQSDQITMPWHPDLYRIRVHPGYSWVEISGCIAWEFDWVQTKRWTVETFLYMGITWRLEYRTRWADRAAPTTETPDEEIRETLDIAEGWLSDTDAGMVGLMRAQHAILTAQLALARRSI